MNFSIRYIVLTLLCLMFLLSGFSQAVVINEVQYANRQTLFDSDGASSDWIELYNSGKETINLKGFRLTDDLDDTGSWYFSEYLLKSGDYLLVFASGKNKLSGDEFHTDFKLKMLQDTVFLVNTVGEIISFVEPVCCPVDFSLGKTDDTSLVYRVLTPSPGVSNKGSIVRELVYRPDSLGVYIPAGFYDTSVSVSLTKNYAENIIYYTLDGSEPDFESNVYAGPVILTNKNGSKNLYANISTSESWIEPGDAIHKANVFRAVVYSDGCPASRILSSTYFIGDQFPQNYSVPIVSVISDPENLFDKKEGIYVEGEDENYSKKGKKWERSAHFEMFDTNSNLVVDQDIGVRIHGRGSRGEPQKSLRLYAREEYGVERFNYPFFEQKNISSYKTVLLSAEKTFSPVIFKDELCHSLVKDMNMDYQAWQTVIVFLNGEYWGIHNLREYQDENYIWDNHHLTSEEFDFISYEKGTSPSVSEGDYTGYAELINALENTDLAGAESFNLIDSLVDVDNMVDYFIAQLYLANVDFPNNNSSLWRSKDGKSKWRWFFYDCEACMQFPDNQNLNEYTDAPDYMKYNPEWSVTILTKLLENSEFRFLFESRFRYHLNTTFRFDRVLKEINEFETLFAPLMTEHIYRWHQPSTIIKWQSNINSLEQFALQRPLYMNEQLIEKFGNPFVISPNPSDGKFSLKYSCSFDVGLIRIFDLHGNLIETENLQALDKEFSFSGLNSGVYMVQLILDNSFYSQKIIVR